jgi:hypothetical protein
LTRPRLSSGTVKAEALRKRKLPHERSSDRGQACVFASLTGGRNAWAQALRRCRYEGALKMTARRV